MQDSEDDDDDESPSAPEVVLVTNDRGNRDAARKAGEKAMTVREFVSSVSSEFPNLVEIIASTGVAGGDDVGAGTEEDVEGAPKRPRQT